MERAHRSWSSVNEWNEELDELNLSFDKAKLRARVVHFFRCVRPPHKDTHGSTPKSQDMPLVRRPIDWWPLWGTEECPTWNAGPDKKCGSLFTYRIEKHLSNVSFSSCKTPSLTVEIKSALISVGTLNESAASHPSPPPHSGILQPPTGKLLKSLQNSLVQSVSTVLSPTATRRLTQICGGQINFTARH